MCCMQFIRFVLRGDSYEPHYIHSDIHNRTLIDRKRENNEETKDPRLPLFQFLSFRFMRFQKKMKFCSIVMRDINRVVFLSLLSFSSNISNFNHFFQV